jgi:hypothetical protein
MYNKEADELRPEHFHNKPEEEVNTTFPPEENMEPDFMDEMAFTDHARNHGLGWELRLDWELASGS